MYGTLEHLDATGRVLGRCIVRNDHARSVLASARRAAMRGTMPAHAAKVAMRHYRAALAQHKVALAEYRVALAALAS